MEQVYALEDNNIEISFLAHLIFTLDASLPVWVETASTHTDICNLSRFSRLYAVIEIYCRRRAQWPQVNKYL